MCFNLLNRLTWLALVLIAVLIVVGLGLFTDASGAVDLGPREALILAGGAVGVIVVLVAYFGLRAGRSRRFTARVVPPPQSVPWYNAPRSLPQTIYESPAPAESTPPHPVPPVIVRTSRTVNDDEHGDTRPMRRVEVPRLESQATDEDTKPTKAVRLPIIPPRKPPPPGPYDDLFPPAQPGDEDYLETSHMEPPAEPPAPVAEAKEEPVTDEAPTESLGDDPAEPPHTPQN